jgi:hypothetical protein
MLVRIVEVSECHTVALYYSTILTNINILCIYIFYLYEHDGIPTCIAFMDSPVKSPEDDLYVGRHM